MNTTTSQPGPSAISKVLVVGGGIGGLSAALALRQSGVVVDLIEQKSVWVPYHVGIIIGSNTLRAMRDLGVIDACVQSGFSYPGVDICNAQGVRVTHAQSDPLAGEGYPTNLGMTRPALHDVLSEAALAAGANVRLGTRAEKWIDDGTRVSVDFSDGTSDTYDLVVAADGIYSQFRKSLFGDRYTPTFTGQGAWRYNVPRPAEVTSSSIYGGVPGGKVGIVPLSQDTMYIWLVRAESGNPRFPEKDLADLFRERLMPYGGLVAKIRDEYITDPTKVVYRPLEALLVNEPWFDGRVLLIGDAVHATTPHLGQGAAQAMEDAVVLGELVAQGGEIKAMLERFVSRRFERCKFTVESSLQIGEWEQHPVEGADPVQIIREMHRVMALPI
jgi:2-polyprenyl-6-methoxyphenol hydroxylase-like FAD-dependent oxidoreductase